MPRTPNYRRLLDIVEAKELMPGLTMRMLQHKFSVSPNTVLKAMRIGKAALQAHVAELSRTRAFLTDPRDARIEKLAARVNALEREKVVLKGRIKKLEAPTS